MICSNYVKQMRAVESSKSTTTGRKTDKSQITEKSAEAISFNQQQLIIGEISNWL